MGTDAQITMLGGSPALLDDAVRRVRDLEGRWSRFDVHSEVSILNRRPGDEPVPVSAETYRLAEASIAAWQNTAGRFDPTVLDAVEANGYDRTYEAIPPRRAGNCGFAPPVPGCRGIELDRVGRTITVPRGVRLDPGGIGKGLGADIVAEEALAAGAAGILVDIGGDIRVAGCGPEDGSWVVDVEDPFHPGDVALRLAVNDVGIATSSRLRRHWMIDGDDRHHLLDPATGRPTVTDVATATVVTTSGWWSEALAKALFVSGELDVVSDASAFVIHNDGGYSATSDLLELMS